MDTQGDAQLRRLGIVYFLAEVQRQTEGGAFPDLTGWAARLLAPLLATLHERAARQKVEEAMAEAVAQGDLRSLATVVDDRAARLRDEAGFRQARADYAGLSKEIAWLEGGGLTSEGRLRGTAQQTAAIAAGCLASCALLILPLT